MSKQLESVFSIEFGTPIWDVRSNGQSVMITERNEETHQVLFSLFDLKSQVFTWEQMTFEEEWWIRLVFLGNQVAIFQTFDDTQDIESQSIIVVNLATQELLWQKSDCRFLSASNGSVQLLMKDEASLSLDIQSGETNVVQDKADHFNPNLIYPSHFEEASIHFNTLKQFLQNHTDLEPRGAFEYFQNDDCFIISANFDQNTGYSNQLFVFSKDGELLLEEVLEEELKGLGSGAFFIVNQELIFVKGKKELLAYSI